MTEFEGLFLRTTLARYAQDLGWVDLMPFSEKIFEIV